MKRALLRGAALVISLAFLVWVVADARWRGVVDSLARLDVKSLAAIALMFAVSYALRAARVHGEFRDELQARDTRLAGRSGYLRILRLTLIHNALVNVVPLRAGEVAFPVLLARWFGVATERAVVSLLWLRTQDACVVLALAACVWPNLPLALRVAAIAAIAIGAWAIPAWAQRHPALTEGVGRVGRVGPLARMRAMLARSTRSNLRGWFWTVSNWSVKLAAEAWLLCLLLGLSLNVFNDLASGALGAIGAELVAILPVQGVAGFGTFEAGAAALLRTQDIAIASGVEAALALHAVVLALALIAGAIAAALLPGADSAIVKA